MASLEEIISTSGFLKTAKEKNIISSLPRDNRDVTIKYLQKTLIVLEKAGLNTNSFLQEFCDIYQISATQLQSELTSEARWVNRWLYRTFLESSRELLCMSEELFYQKVFEETFTDVEDKLIGAAGFFDLGFILKDMNRQNKQWTTLTQVSHKITKNRRGYITLIRETIPEQKNELTNLFGEETAGKILLGDCIATRTAYQAIFNVTKDEHAKITEHTKCEAKGHQHCEYEIQFTPIPLKSTIQRGFIWLLGKLIPELGETLSKYKAMTQRNFLLQDEIEKETRHARQLYKTLEEVADASRRSARHEVVAYERQRNTELKDCVLNNVSSYFIALKEMENVFPQLKNLFAKLESTLYLTSLTQTAEETRLNIQSEIGDIIFPFAADQDRARIALEGKENYKQIVNEFLYSLPDTDRNNLKPILDLNPFSIEIYYQGLTTSASVIAAFEEQEHQIKVSMEGINLPLEQILATAEKQASKTKGKPIQITYNLHQEITIPKPLQFVNVMRDIFFNVIDYAQGQAEVTTGTIPQERLQQLYKIANQEIEVTQYIRIRDFGQGMPLEKVNQTNEYLFGRIQEINTSQNTIGNAGTRDLQKYLESIKNERPIYCVYSTEKDKGTSIEFFLQ